MSVCSRIEVCGQDCACDLGSDAWFPRRIYVTSIEQSLVRD